MAGNQTNRTSLTAIQRREKDAKALELRKSGVTFEQIANHLGYASKGKAHDGVMRAIREITREPAQELLELELSRLDAMLGGLWVAARSGDVFAIDRVLSIMDRRARYLGLNNPTPDAGDTEAREALQALVAAITNATPNTSAPGDAP